jgi:nitronate monooxygenase
MSGRRPLLEILGVRLPIIQAPMAGVSTPEMAAAVSGAGALGSIGVGAVDTAAARRMIREVRARTDRPFNVNLFCHRPAARDAAGELAWLSRLQPSFAGFGATPPAGLREIYRSFVEDADMLAMLLEEQPPVVSFHFGLPQADAVEALRAAGLILIGCATSEREALVIEEAGLAAIVAQGYEAGGHRGLFDLDVADEQLDTRTLTRRLVARASLPVIAAGGVMDGAGIAACLADGAEAAQLGTAFIGCPESSADAAYREALFGASAGRTVMTRVISGRPARCLRNRFVELGESIEEREVPAYPVAYDAGKALAAAARARGEGGFGAQWAGEGAPRARALPAAQLVAVLEEELRVALAAPSSP